MAEDAYILDFLKTRNSSPRLMDPGPSDAQVEEMLRCAMRSPDHAWLRPWRFISVAGEQRAALGTLLLESLLRRQPEADEAARNKALQAPLRAPRLLIVLTALTEHPKVPAWEQRVSAGCAAFSTLLAAEALGYAGVWRTGPVAGDPEFARALGARDNEIITAFIYLGSRAGEPKSLPDMSPGDFHTHWSGPQATG